MPVTQQEFLTSIRNKYPSYQNVSDDQLLSGILKKYPQYSSQISDLGKPTTTYAQDTPFDNLPDFLKAGWNQSITGMIAEKAFGGTQLKLKDEDLSTIEQVGATLSSFIPDFWTLMLGGGLGTIAIKTAGIKAVTSRATQELIKRGISKGTAKLIATKGVQGAITSASQLGVHGGASSTMSQLLYSGQVDPVKVGGDILKSATLGAMAGGTGGFLTKLGLPSQIAAETFVFGTGGAVMEGRLPKLEDFAHSLGVIGALKTYGRARGAIKFAKEKELFDLTPEKITDLAKARAEIEVKGLRNEYFNPQGEKVFPTFVKGKVKVRKGKEIITLTEQEFFRTHSATMQAGGTPRDIEKHRFMRINQDARRLNLKTKTSDKLYRDKLEALTNKTSLRVMTPKELVVVKDVFDAEVRFNQIYKSITKVGKQIPTYTEKKDTFWSNFKEGLKSVEKRIDHTPEGREAIAKFYRSYGLEDIIRADLTALMKGTGVDRSQDLELFKFFERKTVGIRRGEKIAELAEIKGVTTAWNKWMDRVWNYLAPEYRKHGITLPKYLKNYFPHYIKQEYFQKFHNDLLTVRGEEYNILMDKNRIIVTKGEREGLNKQVEGLQKTKFSFDTNKALNYLVKQGIARDKYEALKILQQDTFNQSYTHSGVEKHRKRILPPEMYETDARVVGMEYVARQAKRLAYIKEFGQKGEKMQSLINKIYETDPKSAQILAQSFMARTGLIEIDPSFNFRPKVKEFWNNVMAFEVGTKIGMGFATIPNTTQTFISTIPHVGFLRSAKTALSLMSPTEAGKKLRKQAFPAGMYNQMSQLFGIEHPTKLSKFAQMTQFFSGFTAINKFNAIYASANIQVAIKDWSKMAQKEGFRGKWAKDKLNSLGVDPSKPITDRVLTQAGLRFARSTQLQKHVMRDPLVMNDPRFKPFLLFKRFGYGQAKLAKDIMTDEWRRGKLTVIMPALRLAAGGLLGGGFVIWARDKIKSILSGEEFYREDDVMWKRFIENFSAVGAIGMVSDIMDAENISSSVGFVIKPVPFSDIEVIWKSLTSFERDARKYGLWEDATYIRGAYNISLVMGGMTRQARKRFEQEGHRTERIKALKTHKKNEVFDLMLKGKSQLAVQRILNWNRAHPENPITAADVSYKALSRREKERIKRRLNP